MSSAPDWFRIQVVLLRVISEGQFLIADDLCILTFLSVILLREQSLKLFQHHNPRVLFNVLRGRSIPFSRFVSKYCFSKQNFSICHCQLRQDAQLLTKLMVKEYLGDSATLSYLQIIRKDVESIAGPSLFTVDPKQHQIVENITVLPRNVRNTHLLPEKATAIILVDAFFTNVSKLSTLEARRLLTVNRQVDSVGSSMKAHS